MSLSICANEMHLIRVAEHLGASSRRPRHPFPALMAGETHGRVPVYTALKLNSSCHEGMLIPMPRSEGGTTQRWCDPLPNRVKTKAEAHPWATIPHDQGPPKRKVAVQIHLPLLTATLVCQLETRITVQKNLPLLTATLAVQPEPGITVQIHLPLLTATLVCQLETGIVVVVGANLVVVAETVIQHAYTPNDPLVLEIIGRISSHRLQTVPNRIVSTTGEKKPPPQDITTQTLPRHMGQRRQGCLPTKRTKSSGNDGTSIQRDCERHHGELHNWSCEHKCANVLPARENRHQKIQHNCPPRAYRP